MKKNIRENPLYNWKVKKKKVEAPEIVKREFNNNKFEIFQNLCSKLLRYLNDVYPVIDRNSKFKSLIVETRWNDTVEFTIKNTIQKLGDGWGHIIVCNNDNIESITKLSNDISPNIDIFNLGDLVITRDSYNNLCLDINFWNQFNCERVLIYQSDTYIFKPLDESFFEWDYVGAPWSRDHAKRCVNDFGFKKEILVGNGGLSLRNLNAIKDILKNYKPLDNIHREINPLECGYIWEDLFFSYYTEISENWKLAPVEVASNFSFENVYLYNTFGCHRPFGQHCEENVFDNFISSFNGVNVYGFANTMSGLGHNMRVIIKALEKSKILYNLNIQNPHSKFECFYQDEDYNYFDTNLFLCNPDWNIDRFLDTDYKKNKYNIVLWAWELEKLPEKWIEASKKFDEIWTISEFCKNAFELNLPKKEIIQLNIPGEFKQKMDKAECKRLLNLENKFVVLFTFDAYSDIERKNPKAVIESFTKSLSKYEDCVLIIKSHNLNRFQKFELYTNLPKSVILINEDWSSEKMEILFNSSDIYISLHRSEGSGLTMMEAIMLEIPVVCTNWSGNLDFCLEDHCQLVDYEMIEITKNSNYYRMFGGEKIEWANPLVDDASKKLLEVYQNYDVYKNLIIKNKNYIEEKYSIDNLSNKISERIKLKFDWKYFVLYNTDLLMSDIFNKKAKFHFQNNNKLEERLFKKIIDEKKSNTDYNTPIYLFYHIYAENDWKKIFIEQLELIKESNLIDKLDRIFINIIGVNEDLEFIKGKINQTNCITKLIENEFEFPTLELMRETSQMFEFKGLYIHTKSSSYKIDNVNKYKLNFWREIMNFQNISNWCICYDKVHQYDLVGTLIRKGNIKTNEYWSIYSENISDSSKFTDHFSGNFFWFDSKYYSKLAPLNSLQKKNRFNAEWYSFKNNPNYLNLFNDSEIWSEKLLELINKSSI